MTPHRLPGQLRWSPLLLGLLAASAACQKADPAPTDTPSTSAPATSASTAAAAAGPHTVTLLVTANENGYLSRVADAPEGAKGGAAELLGQWEAKEKHCGGPISPTGAAACATDPTIVLSAGDHWGGPALSSYFNGLPTAEAMARMGYAASAFGNHELDFSRDAFLKAQGAAKFPHLAANAKVDPAALAGVQLPPFKIIERNGVKVGIVGLASTKTKSSVMAGHADGLEVSGYEAGLAAVVPKVWSAGADAVVVLAHECPEVLAPIVASHADWKISLVAGACRTKSLETKGATTLASAGEHFDGYLRAELTVDATKAVPVTVKAEQVAVTTTAGPAAPPDAELAKLIAGWQTKLDAALGEEIGFANAGLAQGSPELGKWITTALRDVYKTDVALVNKKGIRAGLPKGKITRSSVYSVLPYENSVFVLKVKGSDLATLLARPDVVASGITGKPDAAKVYTVATLDYLYFGGDGFAIEQLDADPKETGMLWQTAVVEWTKGKATTAAKPLEGTLK